ncbi:MAG: Lipoprotein-releasing system ATP-binding protein LolD [Elusimicrobia bacterium]|nr:Lipoprotein-releasing system ATP-binding protein LolD [Elusimicrobiota bacterium]
MDFSLETGESVAILGPSGAGKSTFLHMAGLMERPTSGTILINNKNMGAMEDLERAHERLKTIGFLFQFHHLLPDFNVLENVLIPARLAGDNLSVAEKEGKNLLQRLGLGERLMHKPHELSGGEQQRTALARALIRHPKILLCDEPTGNLDSHTAKTVAEIIFAEIQREGIATIIVTHNQALANQSRTVYYLSDGKFEKHRRR